jgi:Bacterial antitoxin of type II TA system, VapB
VFFKIHVFPISCSDTRRHGLTRNDPFQQPLLTQLLTQLMSARAEHVARRNSRWAASNEVGMAGLLQQPAIGKPICSCNRLLMFGVSAIRCGSVWSQKPYSYGRIECMKKTFNVNDKLFKEAKAACGASTDTETLRLGLEALVRHAAYERLRALRGTEPLARDVPRRRERPSPKRRVA